MKKVKLILLTMLAVLVCTAVPVMAAQITATKDTDPVNPNKYHVGDTIHYKMTVSNPGGNPARNDLNDVYDLDPNGDTIYFVEPGIDPPLEQLPGDSNTFYYDYVVAQDNLVFSGGKMKVINVFHASGIDSLDDTPTATVPKNSTILTPCIDVNKTVEPTVSKVGDEVVYTYRICNCGDANLTVTELVDDVLGEIDVNDCNFLLGGVYNGSGELQAGQCCTIELEPYKIPADACDPLINEGCVTGVDEIGGEVNSCDTAMVDLVHPDLMVEKGCPEYSKVGDIVDYNIVITNTGDTPLQILDVNDSLAGFQTGCDDQVLAADGTCSLNYTYQVKQGDPDPLINTVTVRAQVVGLGNILTETTGCETQLIEPNLTVTKECLTDPVTGDVAQFRITIRNTGDVNLIIETNEPELPGPNNLAVNGIIAVDVNVPVPADATEVSNSIVVTATLPAEYDLPNTLTRSASATCPVEVPGEGCRLTGGGVDAEYSDDGCSAKSPDNDRVQFGGQAGAHTALPPQPSGEWTHTQQRGPSGSFTFHAGTASAPAGTEIIEIRCSDPGGCKPSGDPPSPAKQVDFDGVGTFKNFGKAGTGREPTWPDATVAVNARCGSRGGKFRFDGTYHYFQVNADDCGEPGNKNLDAASDPKTCPPDGFGEKGSVALANCDCADFYRITIYNGVDAADVTFLPDGSIDLSTLNTTDVIYEFHGYLDGGNLQVHYLTGFDSP